MSGKLPVVLQIKWRDEAVRIRERKGFPILEELVMFIERHAEAANDPVCGRVGETNQFFQRRNSRASRQPLPPSLNLVTGSKTTTMAVRVGPSDPAKSDKESNSTTLKVKCYGCEFTHMIEHCPGFLNKSIRQRIIFARYKGLCLNCLRKGHFIFLNVNIVNNHIIPYCTNQQRIRKGHWRTLRKAQGRESKQMWIL